MPFYTIGQRKGLGISAKEPLYVLAIDKKNNQLIVGREDELLRQEFVVHKTNWICIEKLQQEMRVSVKIRYASNEVEAIIKPLENNDVLVKLVRPKKAVTPGQSAVFYLGDDVLGGGVIK